MFSLHCTIGVTLCIFAARTTASEPGALIPRPAELNSTAGTFQLTAATPIYVASGQPEVRAIGEYLATHLRDATKHTPDVKESAAAGSPPAGIVLQLSAVPGTTSDEAYALTITTERVLLQAPQPCGLFHGVQTIRQLWTPDAGGALPCLQIRDEPRYRWRGLLLDSGRHFITKDYVKRYIDLLAYHKLNVLHWHLTEDQGWRIEIKKYPKLTEVGAWRGTGADRYGGFYTQDDVREIVAYARSRYITVVPEIEMPGHSLAALAAYPELSCTGGPFTPAAVPGIFEDVYCAGNEATFTFLEDVLTEVLALFPSEFIHIGGDECPKDRWQQCPKCQARIKAEGLKDERELQGYFIRRIEQSLTAHGRRMIGWDEILEGGVAPTATLQSWRNMQAALAGPQAGHDVVSSPNGDCYLNYPQYSGVKPLDWWMPVLPLKRVYAFEPCPAELTPDEARHVLGGEACIWTPVVTQDRLDLQVFPRLCAMAEVLWTPAARRAWDDFTSRLETHLQRLDALGVRYCIAPPRFGAAPLGFTEAVDVVLEGDLPDAAIHYTLDGSDPSATSPRYGSPLRLIATTTVKARMVHPRGNLSELIERRFVKVRAHPAAKVADLTPGLAYAYYEGTWEQLPDLTRLTPSAAGTVAGIDLGIRQRDDPFALVFTGYLDVATEGLYTFYLGSRDGSRLLLDGEVIIDHDGLHGPSEQIGPALLMAGPHELRLEYFHAAKAPRLDVQYEGPGLTKQPVPASALRHPATQ